MTTRDFFYSWNTKYNDYDKHYGAQCKDLFSQFNHDVVGAPYIVGDAKYLYLNYNNNTNQGKLLRQYYNRIPNTLTFVPKEGDVMIWNGWGTNPYGHVAVVSHANLFWFVSLFHPLLFLL